MVKRFGPSCPQQRLVLPNGIDSQLEGYISNVTANLYEGLTADHEDCEAASRPQSLRYAKQFSIPRPDGQCGDT
jgi:hypothetical protein